MNLFTKFQSYSYSATGKLDIVYMIDSTGSMSNWIEVVKNKCEEISLNLKVNIKNFDMNFGGVFYRDL